MSKCLSIKRAPASMLILFVIINILFFINKKNYKFIIDNKFFYFNNFYFSFIN